LDDERANWKLPRYPNNSYIEAYQESGFSFSDRELKTIQFRINRTIRGQQRNLRRFLVDNFFSYGKLTTEN
jgi:hypothetical protein